MDIPPDSATTPGDDCTTLEVARRLGMAVRSVQLMVDRGDLRAWKTPGGHRRIARASVDRWLAERQAPDRERAAAPPVGPGLRRGPARRARCPPSRVLLIEDSRHFQNLVSLLVRQQFPALEMHVADDGISGLAMAGRLQPQVLLVDILLPGIDGATLIAGLRSSRAFTGSRLIVITSLSPEELAPYAVALEGVPVVHKPRLVLDLPALLAAALEASGEAPHG
jgi:excisionase family DNA binding protein